MTIFVLNTHQVPHIMLQKMYQKLGAHLGLAKKFFNIGLRGESKLSLWTSARTPAPSRVTKTFVDPYQRMTSGSSTGKTGRRPRNGSTTTTATPSGTRSRRIPNVLCSTAKTPLAKAFRGTPITGKVETILLNL